jgi:Cu/Ag efflux protein CusF
VKSAVWMYAACFSLATISCSASDSDQAGTAAAPEQSVVEPAVAPVADTAPAGDAAPAQATAPATGAMPSVQRERTEEVSATVEAVDQATRMLTLKGNDGTSLSFEVGPEVKNFPQIRVGDKVVVSYYRGIAAELQPKGTPLSKKVDQLDVTTTSKEGTKPGASTGTATHATVVIEKVDSVANTVTFKRPDGTSRTLEVKSPEGQNFIAKLKKGDQVEVAYTEAFAIEVKPAG